MKVKITETLEIDADAWAAEFGVDRADVRQDVKDYFERVCSEQLERIGLALERD